MIVVVIMGVLAAIAIPRYSATTEAARTARLKSDLRNLQTAMELYYHRNDLSYAGANLLTLRRDYQPSSGLDVTLTAQPRGWSATAKHPPGAAVCAVFVGSSDPADPATVPGHIACADS